ncbi:GspH/FimT family pseudopilin [Gynuella sunshinyii]|uniref:Type II secretion system protein H n=1 Tax=Gynuella sunshinyii YC6258 TaxID=1445510 RepID=A0A0C5UYM4_9GAMM|nr:GspH/FimT family pseudopilin [Gynuella sunshinyii]AJQ92405.1 tfp pilus assembly protein FimT [Gynuella sunshinyii YC6258]
MRLSKGFTLIELLVTIAIMAILMAVAVPSFVQQIRDNQVVATTTKLQEALSFARSEAIKRSAFITICSSTNGSTCLTSPDWTKGWLVFVDNVSSESSASVSEGTALLYWDDINTNMAVSAVRGTSQSLGFLRFNTIGLLAKLSTSDTDTRTFTIQTVGCTTSKARTITVGYAGVINFASATCS